MGKVSDPLPSPSGSSAAAGTHGLSPREVLREHQKPLFLAKREVPMPTTQRERAATRSHQPAVPPATSPSHYTCRTEVVIFP